MKAIILAAGVGSRLRPLTEAIPKTLVEVAGKPILVHQIDALVQCGVTDITVCTGYLSHLITAECATRYPHLNVTAVENEAYADTNNMFSLYLAREHLSGDVFVLNGDVCFEPDVIQRLLEVPGSAVAVDPSIYNEESMKVVADGQYITEISKTISEADAFGCSIDVYKFVGPDGDTLSRGLVHIVENDKDLNQWTEVLLNTLFRDGQVLASPCVVSPQWLEIDNHEDLNQAEKRFNPSFAALANREVFFFDRDGTVSLGETMIEGAAELMHALNARGVPFYILTNNSSRTAAEHYQRLKTLPISQEQVVVSTDATIAYLQGQEVERICLSATASVSDHFRHHGFTLCDTDPEAVVLTYNNEITYADISTLTEALRSGVPYYATHVDLLYPYEGGFLPDIGLFIDMLEQATGRRPDKQFGKPEPTIVEHLLERHQVGAAEAVMVGDRLYTDIALAENSDMLSVLVLSGETRRADLVGNGIRPDVVLDSVADLLDLFR